MHRRMTLVGLIGLFALVAGSCGLLALVVTAGAAWREHAQARWPQAAATIEQCGVDLKYFDGPNSDDPTWWLECKISFQAGTGQVSTRLYSGHRSHPSQGYPAPMTRWVIDHPIGSTILVRYDPTNLTAVPVRDYLPNGEPRTAADLTFLAAFTAACATLVTLTMVLRRRRPASAGRPLG